MRRRSSHEQAELFFAELMGGAIDPPPSRPRFGSSAQGPAWRRGSTGSVVGALQSLRREMDRLHERTLALPHHDAMQLQQWGQRRLESTLEALLERAPVDEPGVLEQLAALTAPRAPSPRRATLSYEAEDVADESLRSPQRVTLAIPTSAAGASAFWGSVQATNAREAASGKQAVYVDGDLLYVAIEPSRMVVVRRTAEELFGTTVAREVAAQQLQVAINGNVFDVSSSGMADIFIGHDPVPASDTSPIGQVVMGGSVVAGSSQPNRFHVAHNPAWVTVPRPLHFGYRFGMGDPPVGSGGANHALGGLGPIIIGGLKYGVGNLYGPGVPAGAPGTGPVPPAYLPYLVQRNNATYAALQSRGAAVGKVVVALCRRQHTLLVLVQRDGGSAGMTLDTLRDKLVAVGCEDAVFGDGSDSVMLVVGGTTLIAQGSDKEEATTIGLGFH